LREACRFRLRLWYIGFGHAGLAKRGDMPLSADHIPGNELLSIVELGGYPDFSGIYKRAGFDVMVEHSMRKALSAIRRHRPAVVVAEFIYGPTYGSRTSNLESLLAGLQRDVPDARLIVFLDGADSHHLDQLRSRFPLFATLFFPVDREQLTEVVIRAAAR
jgi:hypothetical protein